MNPSSVQEVTNAYLFNIYVTEHPIVMMDTMKMPDYVQLVCLIIKKINN